MRSSNLSLVISLFRLCIISRHDALAQNVSPTSTPVSPTNFNGVKWIEMNENEGYTGRHECSFVQAGNKFYLFGGREDPTKLEAYDYTSNTWSVGATVPLPFNHVQATEYQGLIWVIGAFQDNGFPEEEPSEYVSVYDPANNVWMQGPQIPRPRGGGGLVVHEEKFYLVGGNTKGHAGGYVPWLDEYDPVTGQWRILPDASHSRDHFHAAVVGNALYAVGGRQTSAENSFGNTVAEVDVYEFGSGEWRTNNVPDDLPLPRAGTSTAVLNGKVLVIGGESNMQTEAHNEVHALDPTSGTWATLESMNHGRHGAQAVVSGQGVYVVAGSPKRGEGNQKNMEVYNKEVPSVEANVAGSLSAPSSLGIRVGMEEAVGIQHVGGNQGVFVNSIALSGQHMSEFEITSGYTASILIPKGATLDVFVRYNGEFEGAEARLDVTFSGTQTLSIALVGKYLAESPLSAPFTLPMHTPLPTIVPLEQPTPAQAPQPQPSLAIDKIFIVNAKTNLDISTVGACSGCVDASTLIDIRAEPFEAVGSVKLTLKGPVSSSRLENKAPYALFGDVDGDYSGIILSSGNYTITVQAFSSENMGGVTGPITSVSFSI